MPQFKVVASGVGIDQVFKPQVWSQRRTWIFEASDEAEARRRQLELAGV